MLWSEISVQEHSRLGFVITTVKDLIQKLFHGIWTEITAYGMELNVMRRQAKWSNLTSDVASRDDDWFQNHPPPALSSPMTRPFLK